MYGMVSHRADENRLNVGRGFTPRQEKIFVVRV